MNRKIYDNNDTGLYSSVLFIIIVAVFLFVGCGRSIDKATNEYKIIATVTDKGIKNSNDDSKYLVFTKTEDGEIMTLEVTDSFVAGRFNSSDVYAGIEIGKTYEFTVCGERNEFMSWYPNIYDYNRVTDY